MQRTRRLQSSDKETLIRQGPGIRASNLTGQDKRRKKHDESEALTFAKAKGYPEMILNHVGFMVSFNPKTKEPNWVGWHLKRSSLNGPYKRPGGYFKDPDAGKYSPVWEDYKGIGNTYQHGHMCPAEDCKWSKESVVQSCYLTNICPQYGELNAGDWKELENRCRKWAELYGDIYIVCGPIFYKGQHSTVCRGNMVVPEAFFKVVLCLQGEPKSIGFIYKNKSGNRPMGDYINSVDQIERITNIDFFPQLNDSIENEIEAHCDLSEWWNGDK